MPDKWFFVANSDDYLPPMSETLGLIYALQGPEGVLEYLTLMDDEQKKRLWNELRKTPEELMTDARREIAAPHN